MSETRRAVITGRVQGVGYRSWTVSTASRLQLKGWVRNRNDGSVEAVFHGSSKQIEQMLAACHKGPMLARVDAIDVQEYSEMQEYAGFSQRPTV